MPGTVTLSFGRRQTLFTYSPARAWWLNGFDPFKQNVRPQSLHATFTVDMSSRPALFSALSGAKATKDGHWTFIKSTQTAIFRF